VQNEELNAKHKEPGKQELICDIEIERLFDDYGVNERSQREDHNNESERVAGAGLDAEKSANARNGYSYYHI
jgi:hypothetical protein